MVFFQAASRPGGPSARLLLEFVETGRLELYVSGPILEEVRDVLSRPRVRAKNPAITDESVNAFLERSERLARRFDDVPSVYSLARDPDDEPYLNLALAANAEYLVTWDNDMLDLMHDEGFRSSYHHLAILTPVALLQILMSPDDLGVSGQRSPDS